MADYNREIAENTAIATTTFYKADKEADRIRAELAKK